MSESGGTDSQERFGRAHWFRRDELDEDQVVLYESLTQGPRSEGGSRSLADDLGRLGGPFNALFLAPRLGNPLQELGAAVRYESGLGALAREIVILEVARKHRNEVEWLGHSRIASAAGMTPEQLAALLRGEEPEGLSEEEAVVRRLALTLLETGDLDDTAFDKMVAALGTRAMMEVIITVGYYGAIALSMRVWRTPLPTGATPVFTS